MKLENELHTVEHFDVMIKKKEIWSKNFEIGKIAGLLYQIKNAVGWRGRKDHASQSHQDWLHFEKTGLLSILEADFVYLALYFLHELFGYIAKYCSVQSHEKLHTSF